MSVSKHDIQYLRIAVYNWDNFNLSSSRLLPKEISPKQRSYSWKHVCMQALAGTVKPEPNCRSLQGPSPTVTSTPHRGGEGDVEGSGETRGAEGAAAFASVRVLWPNFQPLQPPANSLPPSPLPLSCSRLMVWTQTCWQTGGQEDVWGKAWQKFGVQDRSAVSLKQIWQVRWESPYVEDILLQELASVSSYFTLSELPSSLSFTLSVSLPSGVKGKCFKAWKYARRLGWT